MLEDPFYEETLEGLEELTDEMLESDLDELDSRLDALLSDEGQKPGFWTIWRGIAAAIVLLMAVTSLLLLQKDTVPPTKLLTEKQKSETTDSIPASDQLEQEPDSLEKKENLFEDKELFTETEEEIDLDLGFIESTNELDIIQIEADAKALILESLTSFESDSVQLVIPMEKLNPEIEEALSQTQVADLLKGRVTGVAIQSAPEAKMAFAAPAQSNLEANSFTIKGTVVGLDDGLGLPSVTVFKKGTTIGTQTNLEGSFTLENVSPNSILVFRFLGYTSQEIEIDTARTIKVSLKPDATSLGEVVVTGVAASTEREEIPSYSSAKPVNGYPAFNRYLKDELIYPAAAQTESIKGRVTVEFTVAADGSLSGFEVVQGLGYGCDEEAIRLIKEGPQWQARTEGVNKIPVDSRVRIRIRFTPK